MMSGVYSIRHIESGKVYIGSSFRLERRLQEHRRHLNAGHHRNRYLQRAWNQYGECSFRFDVLLACSKENVLFYEQRAMDAFMSHDAEKGYNLTKQAGNVAGHTVSPETRARLSAQNKGKKLPPEAVERMRAASTGRKHTAETKAKLSAAQDRLWTQEYREEFGKKLRGKPKSEEHRKKLAEALRGRSLPEEVKEKLRGRPAHNRGKPMSQEAKEKMIAKKLGRTPWNKGVRVTNPDTLRRLSESHLGQPAWNKGKKMSDESREKMRAAALNRRNK